MADRVKITIVYDGTVEDFTTDFVAGYYANETFGLAVQFIQGGSDINSFLITMGMARMMEVPGSDLIYFLENDYLHRHGWVSKVFELYESGILFDFASLYDHRDKYFYPMYSNLESKIYCTDSQHWRTTPSTCASFILEKRILDRDYPIFASGQTDYYFFSKLVGEMGRVLLTPLPGLATHSMEGYLSPAVNWEGMSAEVRRES